jgi:hypothetical protein
MIVVSNLFLASFFNGLDRAILSNVKFSDDPFIDVIISISMWLLFGILLIKISSRSRKR